MEFGVGLIAEYAAGELGAFHPPTFSSDWAKFGHFSTVDSDRDDFAGVDAVEQCSGVVSKFARGDCSHVAMRSTSATNDPSGDSLRARQPETVGVTARQ